MTLPYAGIVKNFKLNRLPFYFLQQVDLGFQLF